MVKFLPKSVAQTKAFIEESLKKAYTWEHPPKLKVIKRASINFDSPDIDFSINEKEFLKQLQFRNIRRAEMGGTSHSNAQSVA